MAGRTGRWLVVDQPAAVALPRDGDQARGGVTVGLGLGEHGADHLADRGQHVVDVLLDLVPGTVLEIELAPVHAQRLARLVEQHRLGERRTDIDAEVRGGAASRVSGRLPVCS